VITLGHEITANALIAVRLTQKTLYKGDADLLDAAIAIKFKEQARTWTTEDAREGIAAMTEKRTPQFRRK
jgi:enoyl-CoA hydratase/carnithine racemase